MAEQADGAAGPGGSLRLLLDDWSPGRPQGGAARQGDGEGRPEVPEAVGEATEGAGRSPYRAADRARAGTRNVQGSDGGVEPTARCPAAAGSGLDPRCCRCRTGSSYQDIVEAAALPAGA